MKENQFIVGDWVKLKENPDQIMKVSSNVPGGGMGSDYLQTDKFACDWIEDGVDKSVIFKGDDLVLHQRAD